MRYQQTEISECGLVCVAYAAAKLGAHFDLAELRRRFPISSRGLTLRQMSEISASLGMMARAVKCDLGELGALRSPAILHWGMNHFVVLEKVAKGRVVIHDPASGRRSFTMDEVNERFTGVALELSTSPSFQRRREKSPLSIWSWIRTAPEVYSGLGQVLVLSVMLQLYAVAAPFYMQLAIDQAAFKGNDRLLMTLALGFGLFGIFNVVADLLRNFAVQQVSAFLSWDMSIRLFRHLVRLPLPWFQRRRLADTISRLDSINPIRDLVSGAFVTTLIDGVLALTTLVMMYLFAPLLALCASAATVLYIVARIFSVPRSMRLSGEALSAQIAETSKRIETVKAIQTIKIMSAEIEQELQWGNKYSEVVKKNLAKARFQFSIGAITKIFDALSTTLIVFLGASAIIQDKLTVGVLYAFMSYRGQFGNSISNVVDTLIQWRLSDIYSFRLADIVLHPLEERIDEFNADPQEILGEIEVENLSFRYSSYENWVFRGLNFKIKAGEFVAIVGPSGCGKSTLLKSICGLYPATIGTIKIDGQPITSWTPKALRSALGVVMQDDELLSGSIAENVAFFSPEIDMDRVWAALDAAALKEEVLAMQMKAESLVGDMGGSLSGGQKQRLLIARALYKNPRILIFDEATSHLDVGNERKINESLKALNITRIVIAHRVETIRAAGRIFNVSTGAFERVPDAKAEAKKLVAANVAVAPAKIEGVV